MSDIKIPFNRKTIEWAVKEADLDIDALYKKLPFLNESLEKGEMKASQLRKLSALSKTSLGLLLLDSVPSNDFLFAQFRTIRNKKNDELSSNLKDVMLDTQSKLNWLSEYRKTNKAKKVSFVEIIKDSSDVFSSADLIRHVLNIDKEWFSIIKNHDFAFSFFRKLIEKAGCSVLIGGTVGHNTKRNLDLSEFRGFVLYDDYAPFIFINGKDNDSARLFTLIHEFVHLAISPNQDIFISEEEDGNLERRVNNITSEILIPEFFLAKDIAIGQIRDIKSINKLANKYKCSLFAMAYRLFKENAIDDNLFEMAKSLSSKSKGKSEGGNYYNTVFSNLSRSLADAVFNGVEEERITIVEGARLLGISSYQYEKVYEGINK